MANPLWIFGKKISYFSEPDLRYLIDEIFIQCSYFFDTPNPNPMIVDCGSNIGLSIIFFKILYPQSNILGFEPNPVAFKILERNVEQNNLEGVNVIQCAIDDQDREHAILYTTNDHPGSLTSSLACSRGGSDLIEVRVRRLSSFVTNDVDCLKMDVEGKETAIICELARAKKLKLIRKLIIEYHHHIQGERDSLSALLRTLETNRFCYHVDAAWNYGSNKKVYQDILLHCFQDS